MDADTKEPGVCMTKSQIIKVVLDQMYELYQIDTSEVWPDDSLREFGLDQQSILKLFNSSLKSLGHGDAIHEEGHDAGASLLTAREIVERVYQLVGDQDTSAHEAA